MKVTITRKQIGRIYAGYKNGEMHDWLHNDYAIMQHLYNNLKKLELEGQNL